MDEAEGVEDLGITCDCSIMSQLSTLALPHLTPASTLTLISRHPPSQG